MGKLGGVDLGYIQTVEPIVSKDFQTVTIPGEISSFQQNLLNYSQSWRIEGFLYNPTQAQRENLSNLGNGEVVLVDISEYSLFGYGKLRVAPRLMLDVTRKNIWNYTFEIEGCLAVGYTYIQTSDAYLHDLNYRSNLKGFDPHYGRFAVNYDSNRLNVDYQFYVDNDKTSIQEVIVEAQCGDDVSKCKIYGWKASAWYLIGDWGGADAWDAVKAFTDDDSVAHNFRANNGLRGAALSGIGTISNKLGCKKRVLFSITNLLAEGSTDKSTDYGSDQLLLKIVLEHTSIESLRPYVRITYVDGSLDYGIA